MATYPSSVLVKADVINEVDDVDQNDHNILKGEIIALQTYVGTNPHGSRASLTERLAYVLDTNGGIFGSNAFPALTFPRQLVYRNDLDVLYIRNNSNTQFSALGQALSNFLFYNGSILSTNLTAGMGVVSTTTFGFIATTSGNIYKYNIDYQNFVVASRTFWSTQFRKIQSISNITLLGEVCASFISGGGSGTCQVIMGCNGSTTILGVPFSNVAQLGTAPVLDVSGLTNGQVYTLNFATRNPDAGAQVYIAVGGLWGFGA